MSLRRVLLLAMLVLLSAPAPALAAGGHVPLAAADILGALGGVFGSIGQAVLGAFTWTIGLASDFMLTTIAALVHMLIPHSWVGKGVQIMEWIVAVPDYAGKVSTPGGGHAYGFAAINALRDLFAWLGVAIAPLTLTYATSRAMLGQSEPVAVPLLRVLATAAVIVSYPYWWAQAAAVCDQVTHQILTVPDVSRGLYQLMEYAVGGVALGGWQLIDLGLMGATALCLLGLIAVFLSSRQNGRVFQPNAAGCAGPRWFRFGASSEAASVPGCAGVPAGGASREPCWRRRPPTGPR